jgi:putative hydrolase of HD superfamily
MKKIKNSFDKAAVNLIFELAQLRQEARHGWQRIFENPESVAEHIQRAAVLGFLISYREGFSDPDKIAAMILFHDMHETRTGDADVFQRKYLKMDESGAAKDQLKNLGAIGKKILKMWQEVENVNTTAGKIAKDAEILEMAFTARELIVRGNADAQSWIESIRPRLKTKSGRELLETINLTDPSDWWKNILRK